MDISKGRAGPDAGAGNNSPVARRGIDLDEATLS